MKPTVVLCGNPNTGKSSLFNGLTGSKQRVGNWPGITVEIVQGNLLGNEHIQVIDLPGIYGFTAASPDEAMAANFLLTQKPDVVVNVVDASNLERNLYLTTQIREAGLKCIVVLNMMDIAERHGLGFNFNELEEQLGAPILSVIAHDVRSLEKLKQAIIDALAIQEVLPPLRVGSLYTNPLSGQVSSKKQKPFLLPYPEDVVSSVKKLQSLVEPLAQRLNLQSSWLSLRLFEHDPVVEELVRSSPEILARRDEEEKILTQHHQVDLDILIAEHRFFYIEKLLARVIVRKRAHVHLSEKIDRVVMHRFWGYPIFLGILYFTFSMTMVLGGAFINFFDQLFGLFFVEWPNNFLSQVGTPQWLNGALTQGIGVGIQTVSTFIPIVFFMFFFLAILEDSGYLSRAAFLMDRLMRSLGLPGKAFVPLILGFGCNVPAIMATRTLENQRDRLLTVFMAPLMSCGARLPVYALFAAAFFPQFAGVVIFSLYLSGMLLSIGTGLLLRKTLFKGKLSPFVLEISAYHRPRLKHILLITWRNLKGFIFKAGRVIVLMVAILGVLNTVRLDGSWGEDSEAPTVLNSAGAAIQPLFAPMGVESENWPAAVSLFTGLFAKEAVIGTLNSLYSQTQFGKTLELSTDLELSTEDGGREAEIGIANEETEGSGFDLIGGLRGAFDTLWTDLASLGVGLLDPLGLNVIEKVQESEASTLGQIRLGFENNPWRAYAYLLFILLYIPCVAAISAMVKEVGTIWSLISGVYLAVLAWSVATLFYQVTDGRQLGWIVTSLGILVVFALLFFVAGRQWQNRENIPLYVPSKTLPKKSG